jgi:hypothetical protein
VLTNAQGPGDCSDWTARAIIQSLFDMKPQRDVPTLIEETARVHLGMYTKMMREYEDHRIKDTPCPPLLDFIGRYADSGIGMQIDIYSLERDTCLGSGGLEMRLNQRSTQCHKLQHYHHDVFGFPPAS